MIWMMLEHRSANEEILTDFPDLEQEDIQACLLFAARVNMEFNIARKWQKIAPDLQENTIALVG
jgi:uncharacterized protein (DUF433 family)